MYNFGVNINFHFSGKYVGMAMLDLIINGCLIFFLTMCPGHFVLVQVRIPCDRLLEVGCQAEG